MNEREENDDLLLLRELPRRDVGLGAQRRIREQAHLELARAIGRKPSIVRRIYRRGEPVLVGAVAASYLFWAVGAVLP